MTEHLSLKALEVVLIGEHLRNRLHGEEDPVMIRDRRYHLRTYPCCFVGRDLVDWLIQNGEANSRAGAVQCMNVLFENSIIHHVCDDHHFKDEMLFYRFRRDDDTVVPNSDLAVIYKGCDIFHRAKNEEGQLIKLTPCHDFVYRSCFTGLELVDWLIQNGEVPDRGQAVLLGRELLDQAIIKHVTDEFHFRDENIFYQFMIDKVVNKKLIDALGIIDEKIPGSPRNFTQRNLLPLTTQRSCPVPFSKERPEVNEALDNQTSPESPDFFSSSGSLSQSPRPVVVREITIDELLDPNGPFISKNITVKSDAVGFGFVVRGTSPVYIQTVDPKGPAAAAGLKVHMYLKCVNGKNVLYWTHREVAQEILRGRNVINVVVITHCKGVQ
ncbi:DEP domain-containing mTOR-interacting protein-like isoform X1 [Montipora capricornis]|uniref:DEP domain-containing mTOR-interacting protein-like isoform X1 n=1 Tax=Montipora capricornis TaxID=246305 RepID=UPI0035F2106A